MYMVFHTSRSRFARFLRKISTDRQRELLWKSIRETPIRLEASRLASAFMADWGGQNQRVELLLHLNRTPPTVGDFFAILVLCRVLRNAGCSVMLRINEEFGTRNDWRIEGVQSKSNLLKTWRQFFFLLDPQPGIATKNKWEFSRGKARETWQVRIGDQVVKTKKDFYVLAPRILASLWTKKRLTDANRKAFFLEHIPALGSTSNRWQIERPYFTWHIRGSPYSPERNLTPEQVVDSFLSLCKLRDRIPIVLLADAETSATVKSTISGSWRSVDQAHRLVLQPEYGVVNAATLALGGICHVQEFGGGVSQPVIFSQIPYFISSLHQGSFPEPIRGKAMPWSQKSQRYISASNHKKSSKHLARYLKQFRRRGGFSF